MRDEFLKVLGYLVTNFKEQLNSMTFPNLFTFRERLETQEGLGPTLPKMATEFFRNDTNIEWIGQANRFQEGFIAHYLSGEMGDDSHVVQYVWDYNAELVVETLEAAWRLVYATYPGLRVKFAWSETSNLLQIVEKAEAAVLDWRFLDGTTLELTIQDDHLKELRMNDRKIYFNLGQGHLIRITLVRQSPSNFFSMISFHRAILDASSIKTLLSTVHEHYFRAVDNVEPKGSLLDINFNLACSSDMTYYRAQEAMEFLSDSHTKDLLKVISGCITEPNFASFTSLPAQSIHLSTMNKKVIVFDNLSVQDLLLPSQYDITLNTLLQFTWHRTLRIFLQMENTVVGTTVSGRSLTTPGISSAVGLFMNTLPMVLNHRELDKLNLLQGLQLVQGGILELNSKCTAKLRCLKYKSHSQRPYDCLFTFQHLPNENMEWEEKLCVESKMWYEKLNFPLVVSATVLNNSVRVKFLASDSFAFEAVLNLTKTFEFLFNYIMERFSVCPELQKCAQIPYRLAPPNLILNNKTATRKGSTILMKFFEIHRRFPKRIAVISETRKLTYDDLHQLSDNLATTILKVGKENIGPEKFVALILEQGEWTIIGILGVMKTGSAYVPIDPKFPEVRIRQIIVDCKAQVLVTDKLNIAHKSGLDLSEIFIQDACSWRCLSEAPILTLPLIGEGNLAYLMYTSGTSSTGPKGCLVEHKSVINLIDTITPKYYNDNTLQENIQEVVLQLSNYAFDASVIQMWFALLNGHILLVPTYLLILNLTELTKFLTNFGVTHVCGTPSFLKLINWSKVPTLRRLVVAAETFTVDTWNALTNVKPHFRIIQEYGPTEATVCSSHFEMLEYSKSIGFPIDGTLFYVVDEHRNLLPDDVVGELCIGGVCLARGYIDPNLTARKFIIDPFQTNPSERIYCTGDLVRRKSDGTFDFVGRNDFQVKIRGHRVEQEEIEHTLMGYDQIVEAIVVAKPIVEGGDISLVAYYVGGNSINTVTIRKWLLQRLPSYAVPSSFIRIEQVPLTISGKRDLKSLPVPTIIDPVVQVNVKSDTELEIINIWSHILRIDPESIGLDEDFFALGGDSLLLMQMLDKVYDLVKVRIRVHDIYTEKTVRKFIEAIVTGGTRVDPEKVNKTKGSFKDFPDFSLYEEIEGIGERILLFPPAEGGINTYMENLVPHMKPRPILLFNSLYNYMKRRFGLGIPFEKAAGLYITEIRKIQPAGPYHLVGWSWGGVLAFEIARQMADGSSEFGNVYILDSCFALDKALTLQEDRDYFSSIEDVSYIYHPEVTNALCLVKFTMFKCTLVRKNGPDPSLKDIINQRVYSFYVSNTTANYLDTILPEHCSLEIIPINSNHLEWFRDEATVQLIANAILK